MKHRKLENSELERPDLAAVQSMERYPIQVVLDNIRSLNNIGSVFRTADAFMAAHMHLCGITAKPPHRDIHKTALGATESVPWTYHSDTHEAIKKLKDMGVEVWAVEQAEGATLLQNWASPPDQAVAFVFGNEVKGVAQDIVDLCDGVLEIPQHGIKHSLNISVSAGMVLWEAFKRYAL
jgi:23S rRNA (guanosine2251-2'-O)-methyltransferase